MIDNLSNYKITSKREEYGVVDSILSQLNTWLKNSGNYDDFINVSYKPTALNKVVFRVCDELDIPVSRHWYIYGPALEDYDYNYIKNFQDTRPADKVDRRLSNIFQEEISQILKNKYVQEYERYVYTSRCEATLKESYLSNLDLRKTISDNFYLIQCDKKIDVDSIQKQISKFQLAVSSKNFLNTLEIDDKYLDLIIDYTSNLEDIILASNFIKLNDFRGVYVNHLNELVSSLSHDVWGGLIANFISKKTYVSYSKKSDGEHLKRTEERIRVYSQRISEFICDNYSNYGALFNLTSSDLLSVTS